MPYGSDSLDRVIRKLGTSHTYYPLVSEAPTDGDGRADPVFGDPREIVGRVSSESSADYERPDLGQPSSIRLFLTVPDEEDVELDGRLIFRGDAYRLTEREPATRNTFSRFVLYPDDRVADPGDGDTDTGSDDDGFEWN